MLQLYSLNLNDNTNTHQLDQAFSAPWQALIELYKRVYFIINLSLTIGFKKKF